MPNVSDLNGINNTDWMILLQRLDTFVEQIVECVLVTKYNLCTQARQLNTVINW